MRRRPSTLSALLTNLFMMILSCTNIIQLTCAEAVDAQLLLTDQLLSTISPDTFGVTLVLKFDSSPELIGFAIQTNSAKEEPTNDEEVMVSKPPGSIVASPRSMYIEYIQLPLLEIEEGPNRRLEESYKLQIMDNSDGDELNDPSYAYSALYKGHNVDSSNLLWRGDFFGNRGQPMEFTFGQDSPVVQQVSVAERKKRTQRIPYP